MKLKRIYYFGLTALLQNVKEHEDHPAWGRALVIARLRRFTLPAAHSTQNLLLKATVPHAVSLKPCQPARARLSFCLKREQSL